ncbi:hypothetical protein F441_17934 [Phytophthora nicotianae CJ01A1]|uniref:Uncharacterized protein n=1 Tax=Phytophthora nicotianae CJ01A1 TaxID=1317063 RepID=W2W638_PHYNI|nr:hypothetical protein F441_17934 [Phytophthora nicotianae CJ01A1]
MELRLSAAATKEQSGGTSSRSGCPNAAAVLPLLLLLAAAPKVKLLKCMKPCTRLNSITQPDGGKSGGSGTAPS